VTDFTLFSRWARGCTTLLSHVLGEPLIQLAIAGALLFGLHRWVAPSAETRRIVLSAAVIDGLRQDHTRRNGAPPTAEEEAALIHRYIDNEVLYREALALGLERGDVIVRRRLIQKMEFLSEDLTPLPEPSDADLQSYLDAHTSRYATPAEVTLTHVFVGTDRHGPAAAADASAVRTQLLNGVAPATLGEPFLRGREFRLASEAELAGVFGPAFAASVMALPLDVWSEPLRSSFGWHLVRVTERKAGHVPRLDEVRLLVRRDWQEQERETVNREALDRLRRRYEIQVDGQNKP